jgi:hypothetical protein
MRFDTLDEAEILKAFDDALPCGKALDAMKFFGKLRGALRQLAQIILVPDEIETAFPVEHADLA